jgi:hypothetical protein
MRLLAERMPFYNDHRLCGELKGGVDGEVVWFVFECGARVVRQASEVPRSRPPVPTFEDALLPEALRSWVADVAARVNRAASTLVR